MLKLINKKLLLSMLAKRAGISTEYLTSMIARTEDLFPSLKVDDLLLDPAAHASLIDKYADWLKGPKADLAADYIVSALESVDPDGKAFSIINALSELPVLELGGDYTDVADFCKNGVFPSLLELRAQDPTSSVCPSCYSNECEKIMIGGELNHFCNHCGGN